MLDSFVVELMIIVSHNVDTAMNPIPNLPMMGRLYFLDLGRFVDLWGFTDVREFLVEIRIVHPAAVVSDY